MISRQVRLLPLLIALATSTLHAQPHAIYTTSGIAPTVGVGAIGHCAAPTPDGGSIVCHNTFEPGMRKGQLAMGIMGVAADGRVEWSRMTEIDDGVDGTDDEGSIDGIRPRVIARNREGNYVIAGELVRMGTEEFEPIAVVVIVVDPGGTYLQHRLYDLEFRSCDGESPATDSRSCSAAEVVDMLVTDREIILMTEADETTALAWLTHDGALVRMRRLTWRGEGIARAISADRLIADSSGGLLLFGRGFDNDAYRRRTTVTRLDSSGAVTTSRHLPLPLDVWFGDATTLSDGRVLLVGSAVDTNVRSEFAMISSEEDRPSPEEIERMGFDDQYAFIVLDRELSGGRVTYLKHAGNDPGIDRIVSLATGEIAIIHCDDHNYGDESWGITGYSLLSHDARYISTVAMGNVRSAIPGILQPPTEEDYQWNPWARTGAFLLDDALAGPTGGMILIGFDFAGNQLYASIEPRRPFPCADEGSMTVDTLSRSFTLANDSIVSQRHEWITRMHPRRFAMTQYDIPIGLLPLCDAPLPADSAADPTAASARIRVEDEVVGASASINVVVEASLATTLRIINADNGEIMATRALVVGRSRLSVSTDGWDPGVYLLSIEQGESVKVLVRP